MAGNIDIKDSIEESKQQIKDEKIVEKPPLFSSGQTLLHYDVGINSPDPFIKEGDDLSIGTKTILANYLSKKTNGGFSPEEKNKFPINKGLIELNLRTPSGNPAELTNNSNEGNRFLGQKETINLSNTNNKFPETTIKSSFLSKGRHDLPGKYDGHSLLKQGSQDIEKEYVSPILSKNRFSPSNSAEFTTITNQKELGRYNEKAKTIKLNQLTKIAPILMARATGELGAESDGYDPDNFKETAAGLLPGKAQSGLFRINTKVLESADVLRGIIGEEFGSPGSNDGSQSSDSYGNLNNPNEPFFNLAPAGMVALATSLILSAQISIKLITKTLSLITNANSNSVSSRDTIGRYFIGKSQANSIASISFPAIPLPADLLGIRITQNPFEECVSKGVDVFFGADVDNVGISATGAFNKAIESPGFYAIFVRSIMRSANSIGGLLGGFAPTTFVSAAINNPIKAAESVAALIDTIRRSKIVAAVNVFAQLGDVALNIGKISDKIENIAGYQKISIIDNIDESTIASGKSRIKGRIKSEISSNRTPSQFILPKTVRGAGLIYRNIGNSGNVNIEFLKTTETDIAASRNIVIDTTTNRLERWAVEGIEKNLDAEYVPFYFHDLRTNEIISFYAFLNNLGDSYSANWESHEGYGRVDDIQIYKNTKRKLSFGFFVAATSKQDFDEMWFKINKLVSMIYPQYSVGNLLSFDENNRFIQPFSQIPAASPLIRLRIGDVIQGNFSRFNLARIFGLGTDNFQIDKSISKSNLETASDKADNIATRLNEITVDNVYWISAGLYNSAPRTGMNILGSSSTIKLDIPIDGTFKVKVKDTSLLEKGQIIISLDNDWSANSLAFENLMDKKFIVSIDDITSDQDFYFKKTKELVNSLSTGDEDTIKNVGDFFSEKNAIVRSFKSSAGKGLCGKIDNIEFDFLNGSVFPWSTEFGARAPKILTINMGFSPIHDISPGLASDGFNRAPIYNVGEINNAIMGDETRNKDFYILRRSELGQYLRRR